MAEASAKSLISMQDANQSDHHERYRVVKNCKLIHEACLIALRKKWLIEFLKVDHLLIPATIQVPFIARKCVVEPASTSLDDRIANTFPLTFDHVVASTSLNGQKAVLLNTDIDCMKFLMHLDLDDQYEWLGHTIIDRLKSNRAISNPHNKTRVGILIGGTCVLLSIIPYLKKIDHLIIIDNNALLLFTVKCLIENLNQAVSIDEFKKFQADMIRYAQEYSSFDKGSLLLNFEMKFAQINRLVGDKLPFTNQALLESFQKRLTELKISYCFMDFFDLDSIDILSEQLPSLEYEIQFCYFDNLYIYYHDDRRRD